MKKIEKRESDTNSPASINGWDRCPKVTYRKSIPRGRFSGAIQCVFRTSNNNMRLFFKILSQRQLRRLSEHSYCRCSSTSILDPLVQPWWNWLVNLVPVWLAPNLITVLGLLVNVLTAVVLVLYSPDAKVEVRYDKKIC